MIDLTDLELYDRYEECHHDECPRCHRAFAHENLGSGERQKLMRR